MRPPRPAASATGATPADVTPDIRDAITGHLNRLRETGEPIPEPSELTTAHVEVGRERHSARRLTLVATAATARLHNRPLLTLSASVFELIADLVDVRSS